MQQFLKNNRCTMVQAPVANSSAASSYVDMANCDGVTFIGHLGTCGSTDFVTLAAWGATSTSSTGTAISGATKSTTAGFDDDVITVEVSRPRTRYVKTHLAASAAVEYGGTTAIQYGFRVMPTTAGSTALAPVIKVPQTT